MALNYTVAFCIHFFFKCSNEAFYNNICANLHTVPEQKGEHGIMTGSIELSQMFLLREVWISLCITHCQKPFQHVLELILSKNQDKCEGEGSLSKPSEYRGNTI